MLIARARGLADRFRAPWARYGAGLIEQGFASVLNLALNLALAHFAAPDQYGALVFWTNTAYVLVSLQNAITGTHLMVLPPGPGEDPRRLQTERVMHAVEALFLALTGLLVLTATLTMRGAFAQPAAALFLPAFLAQQYLRVLAFSRGRPGFAAAQGALLTLLVLVVVAGMFLVGVRTAEGILLGLAGVYLGVAALGAAHLCAGQWSAVRPAAFGNYLAYLREAAWIFLGVGSSEVLARFYSFIVGAWYGPSPLAALSATQILLRPIPVLATTWGMVARPDLVRHREAGQWRAFSAEVLAAAALGSLIAIAWTTLVALAWPYLSRSVFAGRYGQYGWMVWLWGLCSGLNFVQLALNVALQALRAFKALALANAAACLAAAAAILLIMRSYGYSGAILGAAIGQLLEVAVMGVLLVVRLRTLTSRGRAASPMSI